MFYQPHNHGANLRKHTKYATASVQLGSCVFGVSSFFNIFWGKWFFLYFVCAEN